MLGLTLAAPVFFAADEPGSATPTVSDERFPVTLRIDAGHPLEELRPIWRFFGADEPNYATMKNGEKLLGELGRLKPGHVYFRTHNLLTTGDGKPALKWGSTNAYTEDAQGNPVYDWTIVDAIFEAGLKRGVKPYVQIGFMPEALSTKPEPYRHHWHPGASYEEIYTGWAYPPTDYAKWSELVFQWVKHSVEKYGRKEVESWYWEVWNEPNIGYWRGTRDEYFKLYDYSVDAVRRALPAARVGGPEVAGGPGGDFLKAFLEHCARGVNHATGKTGSPLDFLAFHAKGAPNFVDGHVRMGIANELRDIDGAFAVIASFPEYKDTPIVIGEADPDGCAACQGPQLGYRNTTLYASYTAASFARMHELAVKHGVHLEGALTWAFEFEDEPYFAGFRQLATNGIDMPVLNTFRMFSKMSGHRLPVTIPSHSAVEEVRRKGVRDTPDVFALAARDGDRVTVLVWHYHDDDVPGPDAAVTLSMNGLPMQDGLVNVTQYRIDHEHSNAYTAWLKQGSPQNPSDKQYADLEKASRLAEVKSQDAVRVETGEATISITLPRQGVALLVIG